MTSRTIQIREFCGLDNVSDPERLNLGWLSSATNVDITAQGAISRRPGYEMALSGSFTGAYAATNQNYGWMCVVDGGVLKRVHGDMSTTDLLSGISAAPMHWAEANGQVFFSNGPDKGIVTQDGVVLAWDWPVPTVPELTAGDGVMPAGQYSAACTYTLPDGRETGSSEAAYISIGPSGGSLVIARIPQIDGLQTNVYISAADSTVMQYALTTAGSAATWSESPDALGEDLMTYGLDPVPLNAVIPVVWRGRVWVSEYDDCNDVSIVWSSEPLGFHLFNLQSSFIQVHGEIVMLLPHAQGLIIGTRYAIYGWSGDALSTLAGYGVPAGKAGVVDAETGDCLFWTNRGLCRGLPFERLTSGRLHVDAGTHASIAIVQMAGLKKLITTTRPSGAVFNQKA